MTKRMIRNVDIEAQRYGVEFEVYLPAGVCTPGQYHAGIQVPELPEGWNAQRDGSLYSGPGGYIGVEIVSPILRGTDGLRQIAKVCKWLKEKQAQVNSSTGFHVHVEWTPEADGEEGLWQLKNLCHFVSNHERAFYAASGTKGRERGNYCHSIKRGYANFKWDEARNVSSLVGGAARFHLLNLTNIARPYGKKTVEFRCFSGTINVHKSTGYVRMALASVEKALTMRRTTRWTAKGTKSDAIESETGTQALYRFFLNTGWCAGRTDKVFGAVGTRPGHFDGEAVRVDDLDRSKAELRRLAEKYDTRG
jgi:hypothetical protein